MTPGAHDLVEGVLLGITYALFIVWIVFGSEDHLL